MPRLELVTLTCCISTWLCYDDHYSSHVCQLLDINLSFRIFIGIEGIALSLKRMKHDLKLFI